MQTQSETVWRQADHYHVPRIAFINKMDTVGADFLRAVKTMEDRLHANALAMQLPIGKQDTFTGIIDLLERKAEVYLSDDGTQYEVREVPEDMKDLVEEYRDKIIEKAAEGDDALMENTLKALNRVLKKLKLLSAGRLLTVTCSPYSAVPHTRTKASRCFWMRYWITCRHRPTFPLLKGQTRRPVKK